MSTKGKEYKLAIRIAGIVDKSFDTSLIRANSSLKATLTAMDKDFTKLDKGFDKIVGAGTKCFSAIATAAGVATAAIGAATAASIVVGSEFESAFAGVRKTVAATDEELAILRQDILAMTREIPSSGVEIAGVMEMAGQLGIAKENLTEFTETMINLGVSTNLSAEEAATALAKFANITGMDPKNYERLGSVIVDLGNNFATTEEEIVSMATRLASTGDLVGLSEAQILALSTAMSSVGIASESGGSTMSKLLKKMQMATELGGKSLEGFAAVAGMTGAEFKQQFQEDAVVALSSFIDGVDNVERNGKSAIAVLDDLGLTEVRLSNTILALAGGEEVMSDAIETANKAWKDNTALAIEAGKRYETVESQAIITKNAFKELGIAAYDELREPLVDALSTVTDEVHEFTDTAKGPNGIGAWLDDIGTELPTLQRKFKKYGEPVFDGIVGVGKWIVKHGDGFISVLAGIGAALAAYKIASTITHIVKALMTLGSMNPMTLGIVGLVAAVGGAVAAYTAYKQHEQDLINENLAEHFGNIALSMEDIQKVAEHILSSDSLNGVKEVLEAFEDIDVISGTMENAIKEIDKMNWKVSIGMELTEDEQESYKAAIDEYVSNAQEYALQSQYAVSLNLSAGMISSEEEAGIVAKVNQFYQDSYDEMTSLGQKLSKAVNDAFADDVLDPKEMEQIVNLQAKMAKLQESLATGEFDAQLSLLGMKYGSGGELTSESFQNLQAELAELTAANNKIYEEAYAKKLSSYGAARNAGYITEAEYSSAAADAEKEYLQNVGNQLMKSINFQKEAIMGQYADDIAAFNEVFDSVVAKYKDHDWTNNPVADMDAMMREIADSGALSDDAKKAIEQLLDEMAPTMEQAEALKQRYAELGIQLSEEMATTFANVDLLGAMTYRDNFWSGQSKYKGSLTSLIFSEIVDNEDYAGIEETLRGYGWELPGEFSEALTTASQVAITPAVEGMYAWTDKTINEYFLKGFSVDSPVRVNFNPLLNGLNIPINQRAEGGLATRPELTWFAEKGPEMAIPIDGSKNAISLWEQTGRLLGMDSVLDGLSLEGNSGPTIEYSPTLQFYGEAPSRDDLEDALRVSQDEFESLMERYLKTHGRVAFG